MSADSMSVARSKSHKNWEKARERFADSCQTDATKTQMKTSPQAWVKSEETETSQTSVETNSQS